MATAPAPCLPANCHAPCHESHGFTLRNCKPPLNAFFKKKKKEKERKRERERVRNINCPGNSVSAQQQKRNKDSKKEGTQEAPNPARKEGSKRKEKHVWG